MTPNLITAPQAREKLGGVSDMSLWRWLNNPEMNFPKPIYIGTRRYFRESEIADWIDKQSEKTAA